MNLPVMVPGLDRATLLDWARRIDAGPYASLAAGERIGFPNPEVLVTLSAAAAVTERVRIVFDVLGLPLHAPAIAAKQVATLDVLSGGRVVLGVGVGAREDDFRAAERPFEGRFRRLAEQVAALRRVWRGETIAGGAEAPVEPAPLQPGGPPLWAGALGPRSIERAARWADGLAGFSLAPSMDEIGLSFERARKAWSAAGRPAPRLVTGFWFALGPDARDRLDAYLRRYLAFLGPEAVRHLATRSGVASAAELRDAVRQVRDLGADELLLVPASADPDEVDRVADVLA